MKLETLEVGQRFFQAMIFALGRDVDNGSGDLFSTREEAEADGQDMVDAHDPEWQKRHPDSVEFLVREYEVDSILEDVGNGISYTNVGSAHTVR